MTEFTLTEEKLSTLQESFYNVHNTIEVMYDYCEAHQDVDKMDSLLYLLSMMKNECAKISELF